MTSAADVPGRARPTLRSDSHGDLVVPRTSLTSGRLAFSVARPSSWNRLFTDLKAIVNTVTFKRKLKTFFIYPSLRSVILCFYHVHCKPLFFPVSGTTPIMIMIMTELTEHIQV